LSKFTGNLHPQLQNFVRFPGHLKYFDDPVYHYFIDRKCDVVNRGFSGYTSAFNKLILPKILKCDNNPKGSIVAVTVLLGSNDSVLESLDSRGLTVEQYIENINNIMLQFINDGIPASQVVLLTPPAVSIEMYTKYCKEMGKRVFFLH